MARVRSRAATPSTMLDVDNIPSCAPSTAARSQSMRPVWRYSFMPYAIFSFR